MPDPSACPRDPQCPFLLQRIDELSAMLALEPEASRRQHWRRQLRLLQQRARCLGCLDPAEAAVPAATLAAAR